MKILWFTSSKLPVNELQGSGTWVTGMLELIQNYCFDTTITIVTRGKCKDKLKEDTPWGQQWVIPIKKKVEKKDVDVVSEIIKLEKPDLIHIWGTEDVWGLLPFDDICPHIPRLLDMQGVVSSVAEGFYADLSFYERLKCWSFKEMIKPSSSLAFMKRNYQRWIGKEEYIIKHSKNISCQSDWVSGHIKRINDSANLYTTGIALRNAFYKSKKWDLKSNTPFVLFSTAINSQPLKGLFTLYKAFGIVHKAHPESKLVLAGAVQTGIRKGGFCKLLDKYARKHVFFDAVTYLGTLSPEELVSQYLECDVFVNPSFVESYSMVVAEAMYLGVPTIASYSGAMGELGLDNSVLYFPKGDYTMCAHQIMKILKNRKLAEEMSIKAIAIGQERHKREKIARLQVEIYKRILNK